MDEVVAQIKEAQKLGKQNFIVMVAEGVGVRLKSQKQIETETGIETRATILGHVQRGGNPTVRDRVAASQTGLLCGSAARKRNRKPCGRDAEWGCR